MAMFSKRCLEELKGKVDVVEVLSAFLHFKRTGKVYKALCPFHVEKSPSFQVEQGDDHYHCFGCGAHGDAIAFLMNHLKLSFTDAVEMLAERFGVALEYADAKEKKGPNLAPLKAILNETKRFYHFHLLHTEEGHKALEYLFQRGLDIKFIRAFEIGLAPEEGAMSLSFFREKKYPLPELKETGLVSERGAAFFRGRITFPIHDIQGNVIGFSARKYKEETFGGKYINTPETVLFKKSKVLFGFNYSRNRIAKEQKAIIVEGQIDALRLIHEGLNLVVAGQGTAFGEEHVAILKKLGLKEAYLAFDGDVAGKEAMVKVGNLFQKEGIECFIVVLPPGKDPDAILKESGINTFLQLTKEAKNYIEFLCAFLSEKNPGKTPAVVNRIVVEIKKYLAEWKFPLMVFEAEKRVAKLLELPPNFVEDKTREIVKSPKKELSLTKILEADLLRWMILYGKSHPEMFQIVKKNLSENDFEDATCRKLFSQMLFAHEGNEEIGLISLGGWIDRTEQDLLELIVKRKVNSDKKIEGVKMSLQKILERNWMKKREAIREKIALAKGNDEEILSLAKQFDELKKSPPKVEE